MWKTKDKRKRIGIDASAMLIARKNGYENYVTSLLLSMTNLHNDIQGLELIFYFHAGNRLADPRALEEILPHFRGFRCRVYRHGHLYGRILPLMALADRLDWLHLPVYLWSTWYPCPVGVTFHDACSIRLMKQGVEGASALNESHNRQAVALASAFIAVSESTKRDLVELYRVPSSKITVVHHGVDPFFKPSAEDADRVRQHYNLNEYILVVNALQLNKNHERLLRAFVKLREECRISEQLVLVGRDGLGAERVYALLAQLHSENAVRHLGYVSREDLRGLYSGARLVVNPSLCEGFGLPLLEAMACGAVLAVSNITALPEVVGDAGLLFDPYDVDSIASAIHRGLSDQTLRAQLKDKSLVRLKHFSWATAARETINAYRTWCSL